MLCTPGVNTARAQVYTWPSFATDSIREAFRQRVQEQAQKMEKWRFLQARACRTL